MNPTQDEIDYTILSNEEVEESASSRLRQMLQWDPEEVLRGQLRDAGVGEARIVALYPFDFANICPTLKQRMNAASLTYLTRSSMLNWVVDETNRLMGPLPKAHKDLIDPDQPKDESTIRIEALQFHVLDCLPTQQQEEWLTSFNRSATAAADDRKSFAYTLIVVLWYATSMMANLEVIQPRDAVAERRRVYEYFCKVLDIALPSFKVFEEARGAISSYLTTTWY